MSKRENYDKVFMECFALKEDQLNSSLEYNSIEEWDSIGHMNLMGMLEDEFNITMDMEDIIDFSSYRKGIELLKKYEVELD